MEKEYIERDAAIYACQDIGKVRNPYSKAINALREIPAADVVEVVRCRDCKFFLSYDRACDHPDGLMPGGGDQYCCYGERREA